VRAISNPKVQRTVEGPNIGFTESRSGNVALVRKLVINHNLSKVDHDILKNIKTRLSQISLDSVLDSNYISEFLTKEFKSFFPLIMNTERPDVVAADVLEGKICIIVGSPYALIAPAVLNQFFQSAEDYYLSSKSIALVRSLRIIFFLVVFICSCLICCFGHLSRRVYST